MAPSPADTLSPPGSSSYDSSTMSVGDGTWDYTKNTFLLPNLVGLNFDTMQYNGMGNRFSTLTDYHTLIKAHGLIATLVFLFLIPAAVMIARFKRSSPGTAIRQHAHLQILSVLLITVVFILGYFAVGPERSLTNPHHGIGVAIYTLILLQIVGGGVIRKIRGRSLRVMIHQWSGRTIALLGIVQIPLGLTLYGSPKYTFVLYALWMAVLVIVYFILSWRAYDRPDYIIRDGRSEITYKEKSGGLKWWMLPLAGIAGLAWWRHRSEEKLRSESREPVQSYGNIARRASSRHDTAYDRDEDRDSSRSGHRFGLLDKVFGAGAVLGAGALIKSALDRDKRGNRDDDYSAVETDSPRRHASRSHRDRSRPGGTVVTEVTSTEAEDSRGGGAVGAGRRTPLLPAPMGTARPLGPVDSYADASRPATARSSRHPGRSEYESGVDVSDYSSYHAPPQQQMHSITHGEEAAAGGLLGGMSLGWLGRKLADRWTRQDEEDMRYHQAVERQEQERKANNRNSRYTGDEYSPPTSPTRRRISRRGPPPNFAPMGQSEPAVGSMADPGHGPPVSQAPPMAAASFMTLPPTLAGPPYMQPRRGSAQGPPGTVGRPYMMPTAPGSTNRPYMAPPPGSEGYDQRLMSGPTRTMTSMSQVSTDPSVAQRWPGSERPIMPEMSYGSGGYPQQRLPGQRPAGARAQSQAPYSRSGNIGHAVMPEMPPDPTGFLANESSSDPYTSTAGRSQSNVQQSMTRQREGEEAAAALAAATAGRRAAEVEAERRAEGSSPYSNRPPQSQQQPVAVSLKVHHNDSGRKVTLRRLTPEETAAARTEHARRQGDSTSSFMDTDPSYSQSPTTPSRQPYRRDAQTTMSPSESLSSLAPPAPAFAGGRTRVPKDSAYYSGPPPGAATAGGPSGSQPPAGHTDTSPASPPGSGTRVTWSGISASPPPPAVAQRPESLGQAGGRGEPTMSAADRARRRRQERRNDGPRNTVDFS